MSSQGIEKTIEVMEAYIRQQVAGGFTPAEEITAGAVEIYGDRASSTLLQPYAQQMTSTAIAEHLASQQGWPPVTDCDRLDAAFAELESRGIVSRQDFWCCGTCGAVAIGDEMAAVRDLGIEVRGYTFYHMQDTESAVDGYGICLNYGSVLAGEGPALEIGNEIADTLRCHGLTVEWDGTWEKRISVSLEWKRRRQG